MEKFLFFTDPHLLIGNDYSMFENVLLLLKQHVEKLHVPYVICGGDWLGNGDSEEDAIKKLGYIQKYTSKLFDRYYHVLGNHDTNYQGVDRYGNKNSGRLNNQTLVKLLFEKYGASYYAFDGEETRFYALDCGIDWDYNLLTKERCEQIHWFAKSLYEDDVKNAAVLMHIYFICGEDLDLRFLQKKLQIVFLLIIKESNLFLKE